MNTKHKALIDFPGYRVGDDGSVWSCRDFQGGEGTVWRKLKPKQGKSGHLNVCLRRDGKTITRWVHRLVLQAFIGECPHRMECRHKNGVPSDNRLCNLMWDSLSENRRDRNRHGIWNLGESHPMAKLTDQQIEDIRERCKNGETQRQVAESYGISQGHVSGIVNRVYRGR